MARLGFRVAAWLAVCLAVCAVTGCVTHGDPRSHGYNPSEQSAEPGTATDRQWAAWDESGPWRMRGGFNNYLANRVFDFTDMFDVSLSVGKWAHVQTDYLIGFWGAGTEDVTRFRFGGRSFLLREDTVTMPSLPFPASLILYPFVPYADDKALATMFALGGAGWENEYAIWPDPVFVGIPTDQRWVRITCIERDPQTHRFHVTAHSFSVGLEAHLLVGARVRVMPLQVFDFIAGIFGLDPAGNDVKLYDPGPQ
jgi:hypothetical protein